MKRRTARTLLLTSSTGVLVMVGGLATAQTAAAPPSQPGDATALETVIVTATKRAENIQTVPMSVSAVSGQTLERQGVATVSEAARQIPSLQIVQSNSNRNSTVIIRGIGSSGTNPGIEPSVGIFVDGVYLPAAGPIQANLLDISALEALRGPQGTLYGRNTPVGAINITTREPTRAFEAQATGAVGNYGQQNVSGYVGGGLGPEVSGRLSLWESSHDGYEKNLYDGSSTNDNRQWGLRARVKWTPADNLTANFIGYYTNIHQHCCTAEPINPTAANGIATPGFLAAAAATGHPLTKLTSLDFTVDDETQGNDLTQVYGTSAQFDWRLGGGYTLTSITAFNTFDDNTKQLVSDGLPQDVGTGPQPLLTRSYSEELRLSSPAEARFEYIAGLYLFRETLSYQNGFTAHRDANRVFPGNLRINPGDTSLYSFDQTTDSAAAFGQLTWHVTHAWRVNGGLRYSTDSKDASTQSVDSAGATAPFLAAFPVHALQQLKRDEDKLTYSIGTQYDLTASVMTYGLVATGYKTGGFNARQTAPNTPLEFNAENSITYELGLKSTLFDHHVVFNADIYRLLLKNFQDSLLNPVTGIGFVVGNAGDRRADGVELDARWSPIDHLSFVASGALTDAKFTNYTAAQCSAGRVANGSRPGTCNNNGLRPSYSPAGTGSFTAQWDSPIPGTTLNGFAIANATYQSEEYLDSTLDPRSLQSSYLLVNLKLGIESPSGRWRIAAYGRNLGNKAYYTAAATQPLGGLVSAGGTAAPQGFVGWYGQPRTYGVELSYRY